MNLPEGHSGFREVLPKSLQHPLGAFDPTQLLACSVTRAIPDGPPDTLALFRGSHQTTAMRKHSLWCWCASASGAGTSPQGRAQIRLDQPQGGEQPRLLSRPSLRKAFGLTHSL